MQKYADIVIAYAKVLTNNAEKQILENHHVIIDGGKIIDIIPSEIAENQYVAKTYIEAKDTLLMPGLVNIHTHAAMTVFRGVADDILLLDWLNKYIFPIEKQFVSAEMVTLGTQLAAIEMIRSGTTTFSDMYYFTDEIAQVAKQIGIRAVISEGLLSFPTPNMKTPETSLEYVENMILKYQNDDLVTIALGPHAPYTCSPELLQKASQLAEKYNVPLQIHLSESTWEFDEYTEKHGLTPTEYLDKLGMLTDRTLTAHSIYLTDSDIHLLAKRGTSVAHNPECNMKLASGAAPVPKMLQCGVNVGIGTDGVASNNNLNMFEEMRSAAFLHKFNSKDPTTLNASTLVEIATINGAKALNLENKIGSIEIGKQADVILVPLNKPHLIPLYNIYSQIVYSMGGSDVDTVIVNGKIVMRNNKILTINEEEVMEKVKVFSEKIKDYIALNS